MFEMPVWPDVWTVASLLIRLQTADYTTATSKCCAKGMCGQDYSTFFNDRIRNNFWKVRQNYRTQFKRWYLGQRFIIYLRTVYTCFSKLKIIIEINHSSRYPIKLRHVTFKNSVFHFLIQFAIQVRFQYRFFSLTT